MTRLDIAPGYFIRTDGLGYAVVAVTMGRRISDPNRAEGLSPQERAELAKSAAGEDCERERVLGYASSLDSALAVFAKYAPMESKAQDLLDLQMVLSDIRDAILALKGHRLIQPKEGPA